jgi:hypothetical protein
MGADQVEIFTGDADRQYQQLGRIHAKLGGATMFSKAPTVEDGNSKLREEAMQMGANGDPCRVQARCNSYLVQGTHCERPRRQTA